MSLTSGCSSIGRMFPSQGKGREFEPRHPLFSSFNNTARTIQIFEGDKINDDALLNLFKSIIKNNRKGGWRKLIAEKQ